MPRWLCSIYYWLPITLVFIAALSVIVGICIFTSGWICAGGVLVFLIGLMFAWPLVMAIVGFQIACLFWLRGVRPFAAARAVTKFVSIPSYSVAEHHAAVPDFVRQVSQEFRMDVGRTNRTETVIWEFFSDQRVEP